MATTIRPPRGPIHVRTEGRTDALWSGTNKKRDVSTGPLARPFAHSLAPLTRSWEDEFLMSQNDLVLSHSATAETTDSVFEGQQQIVELLKNSRRADRDGKKSK